MAKQNAVPMDSDGDASMLKVKSTHTNKGTVILDSGKPLDRTLSLAEEKPDQQLRFVSTSNPPLSEPSLVIPPVSDPPGGGTGGS